MRWRIRREERRKGPRYPPPTLYKGAWGYRGSSEPQSKGRNDSEKEREKGEDGSAKEVDRAKVEEKEKRKKEGKKKRE